jgi:pimeloyl-ACP methyl ester carboxylesterase
VVPRPGGDVTSHPVRLVLLAMSAPQDTSMAEITITSPDGTRLAARHSGSGTPIVLVHGVLVDIDSSAAVEPLLAARHHVWAYSWRGHGDSDDSEDLGPERQVEDVLAVVEAAGGDVHLCG